MARFTDIFSDETKEGYKIPKEKYLKQGTYPIIDQGQEYIAGYTNDSDGLYRNVPAIIFGDHTRIIKYIDMPFFLGADGVKLLKAKDSNANYKYLYYALTNAKIPNTGYNRHFKWLKEVELSLPSPSKQLHIVTILDKLTTLISLRKQQLAKLDELVKARFVEMFGEPIKNPMNWNKMSIKNVCQSIYGGGTPSKNRPEFFSGKIPWVSPKDLKSLIIKDSIDHITEDAIKQSSTNLVPKNSILMVIRSGILKHSLPVAINIIPVTINQDMKAFIPNESISAEYLLYYFKLMEKDILTKVRSVTADNIDFKDFLKRMMPVPPTRLQLYFADFVNRVFRCSFIVQQSIDKMEVLKKSLMQKYFG